MSNPVRMVGNRVEVGVISTKKGAVVRRNPIAELNVKILNLGKNQPFLHLKLFSLSILMRFGFFLEYKLSTF